MRFVFWHYFRKTRIWRCLMANHNTAHIVTIYLIFFYWRIQWRNEEGRRIQYSYFRNNSTSYSWSFLKFSSSFDIVSYHILSPQFLLHVERTHTFIIHECTRQFRKHSWMQFIKIHWILLALLFKYLFNNFWVDASNEAMDEELASWGWACTDTCAGRKDCLRICIHSPPLKYQ